LPINQANKMNMPTPKQEIIQPTQVSLDDLIKDTQVSKFFTNSFQCGFSTSDANIVFKYNSTPVALLTMGMPAVKTLKNQLEQLLLLYEKSTKQTVLSIEELVTIIQADATTK
jgi:hypothetical protein